MKNSFLVILMVLVQFAGFAQNETSKEEKEVANRVEVLRKAMVDADGKTLSALSSEQLSYVHSSGKFQDKAAFVDGIASGKSDFVTIEFQDQTITIDGDVAIVRHNLAAHTKDDGIDKDIKIGIMLVWKKEKKEWLLLARQAFKLP